VTAVDGFDAAIAREATGALRDFNQAGLLAASDVHVALRLARLGATAEEAVLLGAAFAVRAPRLGHVRVDLATISSTATSEGEPPVDAEGLPWPEPGDWVRSLRASPVVGEGRPLRMEGTALYLDRFWSQERQVARDLHDRAGPFDEKVDAAVLAAGLARLFVGGETPDLQRVAAGAAVLSRFSVIAGGPGTGKTTTVARVLALLDEQAVAAGARLPMVALAAPTGKAAARLEEAVHGEADALDVDPRERSRLKSIRAMTLHRLLGFSPGNRTRFSHNRLNRLTHDVVVVDETSMVSLSLMARLVEAVRPEARLILVGDPEQLASVEAGAVLGDIVGPATRGLLMGSFARTRLSKVTAQEVPTSDPATGTSFGDGIVVLRRVHRYGGAIAEVAEAIQAGDPDGVLAVLGSNRADALWIPFDVGASNTTPRLRPIHDAAVETGRRTVQSAREGRSGEALAALNSFRLLCAHRHGPYGVATWMARVEAWLAADVGLGAGDEWYPGRPLLVTENDYSLRLYNGDTGVVVARGDSRVVAAFERGGEVVEVSPTRLASVDTVYAMTVHKAQGSQFEQVAVILPQPGAPVLTRELLYTAVTRARRRLIVAATEDSIRSAVSRPITRSSGLRDALWGGAG
jgi:exodeoxyribonuclease V alpha subunit